MRRRSWIVYRIPSSCLGSHRHAERGGQSRPHLAVDVRQPPPPSTGASFPSSICFRRSGTGSLGFWRLGIRSVEAPPTKRRTFGNFMTDLSNSIMTGEISAKTQPLSCPAYLPGEACCTVDGAAPLKVMSYFSYGSIVRL